jgi:hypothetical protein
VVVGAAENSVLVTKPPPGCGIVVVVNAVDFPGATGVVPPAVVPIVPTAGFVVVEPVVKVVFA